MISGFEGFSRFVNRAACMPWIYSCAGIEYMIGCRAGPDLFGVREITDYVAHGGPRLMRSVEKAAIV